MSLMFFSTLLFLCAVGAVVATCRLERRWAKRNSPLPGLLLPCLLLALILAQFLLARRYEAFPFCFFLSEADWNPTDPSFSASNLQVMRDSLAISFSLFGFAFISSAIVYIQERRKRKRNKTG